MDDINGQKLVGTKTIALVMIVKNEERYLKRCLDSAKDIVDRMIIVDTGSDDSTPDIARAAGADVYPYIWKNDFADARNYALSFSDADLNLILDADEYISSGARDGIVDILGDGGYLGDVYIHNGHILDGEKIYSGFMSSRVLPKGVRYTGRIHEQPDCILPRVSIPIVVEHDGYLYSGKKEKRNLPYLLREVYEHPADPYFLYKTACSFLNIGKVERAFDVFRMFYDRVPLDNPYWAKGMAGFLYTLIVLSDTDDCMEYIPRIEQSYMRCLEFENVSPELCRVAYNLGLWHEMNGDTADAAKYYSESFGQGYSGAYDRLMLLCI